MSGKIVVGFAFTGGGTADLANPPRHAFAYDLGAASLTMRDLGTLGGRDSWATAVSGNVVVGTSATASGANHAFAYDLGASSPTMRDLGVFGGDSSSAVAVSDNIVVGGWTRGRSEGGVRACYPEICSGPLGGSFIYGLGAASPKTQNLGASISAVAVSGNVVVGSSATASRTPIDPTVPSHALAYDLGTASPTMRDLGAPAGGSSWAVAVSGHIVVGTSVTAAGDQHVFAYDLGAASPTMRDLGPLAGSGFRAVAVSGNILIVVGYASAASNEPHGLYYDLAAASPTMRDLGTLGGRGTYVTAVSGNIVVGLSSTPDGRGHPVAWNLAKSATPPGVPTGLSGRAGQGSVTLSWSPPANSGGRPITAYRVTPYVGRLAQPAVTFDSAATTQNITGLANGTTYTFTVAAINAAGSGPPSGPSTVLTPP